MFPYNVETPLFRSNRAVDQKAKQTTTKNGGPIEVAAFHDLTATRIDFLSSLQQQQQKEDAPEKDSDLREDDEGETASSSEAGRSQHAPEGRTFMTFKDVFKSSNFAALHNRFLFFTRQASCGDRGSYAQLLYGTALRLLNEAFHRYDAEVLAPATAQAATTDSAVGAATANATDGAANSGDDALRRLQLLEHAAFAVFSLYALYETNPLEKSVSSAETTDPDRLLSMLPVGLHCHDEYPPPPRGRLVRRAYRDAPIRIDAKHYSLLIRLHDVAEAQLAYCEADRLRYERVKLNGGTADGSDGFSPRWRCQCAVATDVLCVLDRLESCLEFCSYTGPCGLEALAGHRDYNPAGAAASAAVASNGPVKSASTAAKRQANSSAVASVNTDSVDDDDVNGKAAADESADTDRHSGKSEDASTSSGGDDDLQSKLKGYLDSCAAIELMPPPSFSAGTDARNVVAQNRRRKRIRDAIMPIFSNDYVGEEGGRGDVALFIQAATGAPCSQPQLKLPKIKHRVTFGDITIRTGDASGGVAEEKVGSIMNLSETDVDSRHAKVSESRSQSEGGHGGSEGQTNAVALEFLLPGGLSTALEDSIKEALETIVDREPSILLPSIPGVDTGGEGDEVSALGTTDGVSISAGSKLTAASGVGRSALRNLLSQVTNASDASRTRSVGGSMRQSYTGDAFFRDVAEAEVSIRTGNKQRNKMTRADELDMSDISSDEDAVSVAVSTVGQRALDELLALKGEGGERDLVQPVRKREPASERSQGPIDSSDAIEDASSVAASAIGRNALNELLAASAESGKSNSAKTTRKREGARRKEAASHSEGSRAYRAGRLRDDSSNVIDDNLSVAGSAVGRNALNDLLDRSAANGERDQGASLPQNPVNKDKKKPASDAHAIRSKRPRQKSSPSNSSSDEGDVCDDAISATESTVGRNALGNLLAKLK